MVIGIDISITSTGLVVVQDGEVVEYQVIKTTPKDNMYKRSLKILTALDGILNKFKHAHVVIEAPAFMGKGARVYQLFGLHFLVATLVFRHKGDTFVQVPPTTLKKFATGSGRADKQAMLEALPEEVRTVFIQEGYKKSTGLYDLADAYHLAVYKKKEK